jgi:hypothetical protein
MIPFLVLTGVLFGLLLVFLAIGRRKEVMDNWKKYRAHPLYAATAFLYKPADDPRSRFQFADDNFREVMKDMVGDAFKVAFMPLMGVFQILGQSVQQSVGSMGDVRAILQTMMESFDKVFSIFERRYESTLHRVGMTFQGLQTAMNRLWGVAINSVWQSIAVVQSIFSTLDLIMKIIIIILAILVGIILFLFLFLWPLLPVILSVVGILATAGMGAAVGGMASTFCFTAETPIVLHDGRSTKPISAIRIGDRLFGNEVVTATMVADATTAGDLFELDGIRVSGSHIVFEDGTTSTPMFVSDHPRATRIHTSVPHVYCLNTSGHRIPVMTTTGTVRWFADWEELSDAEEDQQRWNQHVYETLNPGMQWVSANAQCEGEAVLHPATMVRAEGGAVCAISELCPGDIVQDADGRPTRVIGTVAMNPSMVGATCGAMSAAAWIRRSPRDRWVQPKPTGSAPDDMRKPWRSIFTESGSFLLDSGIAVRDFSDVGLSAISKTYPWVLAAVGRETGCPK